MKAIVTGGAGFIGSNLVNELIKNNIEVTVIDNLSTGKRENINERAEFLNVDISEDSTIAKLITAMEGGTFVFHLAAWARVQPSLNDPILFNKNNVNGSLNVFFAAYRAGIKRVIFSSSSSVYGHVTEMPLHEGLTPKPMSPYGLQKWVGEQYAAIFSRVYNLETVSLRYFNVYGENLLLTSAYRQVIGIFASKMMEGKKLTITNEGNQKRDFIYVKDVVQANLLAAFSEQVGHGESINIGQGNNISINELANLFGGEIEYIGYTSEPNETLADISKAFTLLGWKPTGNLREWIHSFKDQLGI